MNLKRPLYGPQDPRGPSHGRDVKDFVKRTLYRMPAVIPVGENFFPKPKGGFDEVYNAKTAQAVAVVQGFSGIHPASGNMGQATFDVLWGYADAYSRWVYKTWTATPPPTPQEIAFNKLLLAMQQMDAATPGYQLGGEHGIPLEDVDIRHATDCSSSCSWVLWKAGLFDGIGSEHIAAVSGQFASWGAPGLGNFFTVYANYEHVWIRLHKSKWWRFDTSPHGDGGRGPHLRYLPRFTSSFTARHFEGM